MTYWRMQLHPSQSGKAMMHAVASIAAGYIGLDFREDVGDLARIDPSTLSGNHPEYYAFANEMSEGDRVLVMVHHFPFALTKVAGPYNYIRNVAPEIGVWFRHFRKVDDVRYYADWRTNAFKWERIVMNNTISPLRSREKATYQLIEEWVSSPA